MGYSDFSFAALLYPALTTVSQPFIEMGRVATQILLQRLDAPPYTQELPSEIVLPTRLTLRNSTGMSLRRRQSRQTKHELLAKVGGRDL
jgi:LacI family transcriptional regulator